MLRWPTILPHWKYADPATTAVLGARPGVAVVTVPAAPIRAHVDRYYTQARRLRIRQLMRGRR